MALERAYLSVLTTKPSPLNGKRQGLRQKVIDENERNANRSHKPNKPRGCGVETYGIVYWLCCSWYLLLVLYSGLNATRCEWLLQVELLPSSLLQPLLNRLLDIQVAQVMVGPMFLRC